MNLLLSYDTGMSQLNYSEEGLEWYPLEQLIMNF